MQQKRSRAELLHKQLENNQDNAANNLRGHPGRRSLPRDKSNNIDEPPSLLQIWQAVPGHDSADVSAQQKFDQRNDKRFGSRLPGDGKPVRQMRMQSATCLTKPAIPPAIYQRHHQYWQQPALDRAATGMRQAQ